MSPLLLNEIEDVPNLYKSLLEQSEKIGKMGSWWIDLKDEKNINNNSLRWSSGVYIIFGYKPGEVEVTNDLFFSHVHPDDRTHVSTEMAYALRHNIPYHAEHRIIKTDGNEAVVLEHAEIIKNDNESMIVGVVRDITDERKADEEHRIREELIRTSLKEKETLLRELYHRTKNNMQIISSLLSLKSLVQDNTEVNQVLQEMRNRIQAIAVAHQKLYQTKNLSVINLKEYLSELINLLRYSYDDSEGRITFNVNLKPVNVSIDTAVPLGLIFNELISNSLKYAFPENRGGNITITLDKCEDDCIEFQIADNGVGIKDSDLNIEGKLGLQLFKALSEQLNAKTEMLQNKGVCWKIRFKENEYLGSV